MKNVLSRPDGGNFAHFSFSFNEANSVSSPYWCEKLIKTTQNNTILSLSIFFPDQNLSGHSRRFWTCTQTSLEDFKEMLYLVGKEVLCFLFFLSYKYTPGSARSFLSSPAETKTKSSPSLKLNSSLRYRRCLINRTCQRSDVPTTGSAYILYMPWSCDLLILIKCTLHGHTPLATTSTHNNKS